jgi:osmotically-inducible protein OsmY
MGEAGREPLTAPRERSPNARAAGSRDSAGWRDHGGRGLKTEDGGQRVVEEAKRRIVHQPHLAVQRIWCEFDGGTLILRGHVPSFYHKQLAQTAVARMEGVRQVVNQIEVIW